MATNTGFKSPCGHRVSCLAKQAIGLRVEVRSGCRSNECDRCWPGFRERAPPDWHRRTLALGVQCVLRLGRKRHRTTASVAASNQRLCVLDRVTGTVIVAADAGLDRIRVSGVHDAGTSYQPCDRCGNRNPPRQHHCHTGRYMCSMGSRGRSGHNWSSIVTSAAIRWRKMSCISLRAAARLHR